MTRYYFDHAATTPILPEARQAMVEALDRLGNPSSLHADGRRAKDELDIAREKVATRLGCLFGEIIFTASGSESANLAVIGTALSGLKADHGRREILLSAVEHHCVLETREALEALGFRVSIIPVLEDGRVDLNWLETRITDGVLLVSVIHANNEIGTWQPVATVAQLCHQHGVLLHVDAVQSFLLSEVGENGGFKTWTVTDLGADLVTVAGHKVGGPVGACALYVRAGTGIKPVIAGGGQERDLRAGTENTGAIIGFAAAIGYLRSSEKLFHLREVLQKSLSELAPVWTVPNELAHPGIIHFRLPGVSAESALIRLDQQGVSAASGAACSSGSVLPSHVLKAIGWGAVAAKEGLRFSLSSLQSSDEVRAGGQLAAQVLAELSAKATSRTFGSTGQDRQAVNP